jgi:hypothetical protein
MSIYSVYVYIMCIYLSVCLSVYLFICLSIYLSLCMQRSISICIDPSIYIYVLHVCISISQVSYRWMTLYRGLRSFQDIEQSSQALKLLKSNLRNTWKSNIQFNLTYSSILPLEQVLNYFSDLFCTSVCLFLGWPKRTISCRPAFPSAGPGGQHKGPARWFTKNLGKSMGAAPVPRF